MYRNSTNISSRDGLSERGHLASKASNLLHLCLEVPTRHADPPLIGDHRHLVSESHQSRGQLGTLVPVLEAETHLALALADRSATSRVCPALHAYHLLARWDRTEEEPHQEHDQARCLKRHKERRSSKYGIRLRLREMIHLLVYLRHLLRYLLYLFCCRKRLRRSMNGGSIPLSHLHILLLRCPLLPGFPLTLQM